MQFTVHLNKRQSISYNRELVSFVSGPEKYYTIQNCVLHSLYDHIIQSHNEKHCFRVIVVIPLSPGFQGGVDDACDASVRAIIHCQYQAICREKHLLLENLQHILGANCATMFPFMDLVVMVDFVCKFFTSQIIQHKILVKHGNLLLKNVYHQKITSHLDSVKYLFMEGMIQQFTQIQ